VPFKATEEDEGKRREGRRTVNPNRLWRPPTSGGEGNRRVRPVSMEFPSKTSEKKKIKLSL